MGTYTTNLRFYKPASTEFVDPEVQLNRNWDIADAAVRRLMEYEYSNAVTPDIVDSVDRARFYKSYSNSICAYFRSGNFFYSDPTSFVSTWNDASSLFTNGTETADPDFPPYYRVIKKSGGTTTEIEWTGAFWANGGNMDLNTNITGVMTLPAQAIPTVSKYFNCNAGNTVTSYSFARVVFLSSGTVEYKRYGVSDQATAAEKRIDLSGIKYNLEVAA